MFMLPVTRKTSKTNHNKTWILIMVDKGVVFTKDKPTSRKSKALDPDKRPKRE